MSQNTRSDHLSNSIEHPLDSLSIVLDCSAHITNIQVLLLTKTNTAEKFSHELHENYFRSKRVPTEDRCSCYNSRAV